MYKRSVVCLWRLCLLVGALCVPAVRAQAPSVPADLLGPWQQEEGDELLLVEANRLVGYNEGRLRTDTVLRFENGCLTILHRGIVEHLRAVAQGSSLTLTQPGQVRTFRRLAAIPDALRLNLVPLGKPLPLPAERVTAIQAEIANRLLLDNEVNKRTSAKQEEVDSVVAANTRYLLSLVKEIGWIDTQRFGSRTSYAAVILAKHGGDLRLLLAALPLIERDFKNAGDDAQAFAIVYDSIQLDLGRRQRFGTQIRGVGDKKPFVLPLEDAARVDEYRKEIGLTPLAAYLSDASKVLEMEIAMPPAENLEAGCISGEKTGR